MNVTPVNILEVTSFMANNVHLCNLTPDLSGITKETGYYSVNQGDSICCNSRVDMCTYNAGNLTNVSSCVYKRDSTDPPGYHTL